MKLQIPRLNLFEWHDMETTPVFLRHMFTELLMQFWVHPFPVHEKIAPVLADALHRAKTTELLDLCAGSGGPLPAVAREMQDKAMVRKLKIHPNVPAWSSVRSAFPDVAIEPVTTPVDATDCKEPGFRTIFGAYHHFPPALATKVLQDAVDSNSGIAIFEVTRRSLFLILTYLLFVPFLTAPLVTLFVLRPLTFRRFFLTFVIPVLPLMVAWDATVSCLRTWTPQEMREKISGLRDRDKFDWQTGELSVKGLRCVVYTIGTPKQPTARTERKLL